MPPGDTSAPARHRRGAPQSTRRQPWPLLSYSACPTGRLAEPSAAYSAASTLPPRRPPASSLFQPASCTERRGAAAVHFSLCESPACDTGAAGRRHLPPPAAVTAVQLQLRLHHQPPSVRCGTRLAGTMGAGWRRFTERLHQTGPSFDGNFQPTSNARCRQVAFGSRCVLSGSTAL